jgi:signal transduction histidine kinase
MTAGADERSLSRALAIQMTLVALGMSLALVLFFGAHYLLHTQELRRLTLEQEVQDIVTALRLGQDPSARERYRRYPQAYGFRVFDHRQAWQRRVISEANPALLSSVEAASEVPRADTGSQDFVTGLAAISLADRSGWMLTDRGEFGDRVYWVQAVMIGDPAWLWLDVMAHEMLDHVMLPVLFIVPALTLAAYLTTRRALRPLTRVASQASELGRAVVSGARFAPLRADRLPIEFRSVVDAINAMLGKLERSLTLQKQFTSDVAHELRTPLAVMVLEASQLPQGPATDRFKRELTDLADLINQLLRFAQAEDAMARDRQPVDIASAARKVCEDLARIALERKKRIEFDAPDEHVLISGHPALVDAAIRNVVDNAIKASPPESTISVTVDRDRRVIVDDRGPGVPEPHKKLIFDRLWRARRQSSGMGIGLALVRRIALMHGGDVQVEDRPGGGARFVLLLAPGA